MIPLCLYHISPNTHTAQIGEGKSLYHVNEEKLKKAAPTLLITQDLCQVCGPSGNAVTQVLKALKPAPEILWQTPKTFDQVLTAYEGKTRIDGREHTYAHTYKSRLTFLFTITYVELGRKTGRLEVAQAWVKQAKQRVADIASTSAQLPKVKIAFLEWVDPLYCGGHWVPQMLEWAGAMDMNSNDGTDSVRISWEKVVEWAPEVVIVAPCGFKVDKALEQAKQLFDRPGYADLPAVKSGRVFAVDANSYYARPGPRVVEGVEILAHLAHPDIFPWNGPKDAFTKVEFSGAAILNGPENPAFAKVEASSAAN